VDEDEDRAAEVYVTAAGQGYAAHHNLDVICDSIACLCSLDGSHEGCTDMPKEKVSCFREGTRT
jgi:hypothetical protein